MFQYTNGSNYYINGKFYYTNGTFYKINGILFWIIQKCLILLGRFLAKKIIFNFVNNY